MLIQPCTKRGATRWLVGLSAGLIVALTQLPSLTVHSQQAKTAKEGVYTEAQASRGEGLYGQQCAGCHASDLSGSGAPALAGADFFSSWDQMSVADLVEKISTSMPSSSPGSLTRVQAADLVAFILKSNKFPAGPAELDSDVAALKLINIVK